MEVSSENAYNYLEREKQTRFDTFFHRMLYPGERHTDCAHRGTATVRSAQGFALLRSACIPEKKSVCVRNIGSVASFAPSPTRGVSAARTPRLVVARKRLLANDSRFMSPIFQIQRVLRSWDQKRRVRLPITVIPQIKAVIAYWQTENRGKTK